MTTPGEPEQTPSFGARLDKGFRTFVRALARLLLILFVIALIGLALYYGFPFAYNRFIQPVQENTLLLESLQTSQAQVDQQLSQNLIDARSRLGTLESQHAADVQDIATLQARVSQAETRADSVESQIAASTARLAELDSSIKGITSQVTEITATLKTNSQDLQGLTGQVQAGDPQIKTLSQELQVLKGMELITRSRLFLSQNNLGLAQQDIQSAYDLLNSLQGQVPAYQVDAVSAVAQRLKLSLGNLPGSPVLAADDLEIAWQMLVRGLPSHTPQVSYAAAGVLSGTPTVTSVLTSTVTITPTVTITVTPALTEFPLTSEITTTVTPTP